MKRALLLIDHGSRREEANAVLVQVVEFIRNQSDFAVVHHAHLEIAEPTIAQGFDACVADGAEEVIIHPYFLAPGSHYNEDIPRLVAEAAAKHPGVRWIITEPLGVHPKLCEVVLERVANAIGGASAQGSAAMPPDATEVKRAEVRQMFASIVHRYDFLNRLLSFRRDVYWRRVAVTQGEIPRGGRALDLCAGTADVALEIIRQVPAVHVIAVDNCEPMLLRGLQKARRAGVAHQIDFVAAPAERLPFPDKTFDAAFVAFGVRNIAERRRGLEEMARVLRPGGRVVILEFSAPTSPIFGSFYRWYSHSVLPWAGGLLSGNRAAYEYLPTSVDDFPTPEELRVQMENTGFFQVSIRPLTHGIVTIHQGRRVDHRA